MPAMPPGLSLLNYIELGRDGGMLTMMGLMERWFELTVEELVGLVLLLNRLEGILLFY